MDDAAPRTCWRDVQLQPVLTEPVKGARYYAELRVKLLEGKIDLLKEKLGKLEEELAVAKAEWAAIQAGDAEPEHTDESLESPARNLQWSYQKENEAELDDERHVIQEFLDATSLRARGWFVSDVKVTDWSEHVILTRVRVTPRKRNNAKAVLAALKAAARAHIEAKRGGADESRCKEAAETAYNRQLGDLGAYGSSVKDMPLIDAFRAARLARNEARDQGLPEDEQSRRAHQAFKAIMAAAEEQRATGPPT